MLKSKIIRIMNIKSYSLSLFLLLFILPDSFAATPPIVTNISPQSGPVGTSVTISGSNFNAVLADNIVYFGTTLATVTAASVTSITVISPTGASFQPITVLNTFNGLIGYSPKPFITTNSTTSFVLKPKVDSVTGAGPKNIAAGDFDNDGKPDLVVSNSSNNSISDYANGCSSGTVIFMAPLILNTGLTPYGVAVGDLDGDGKLDIAVANSGTNTISVFRNTSSGGIISFASPIVLTSTASPVSIAITDLDGDGQAEIITAPNAANIFDVFRNISTVGTLTFGVKKTFSIGGAPQSITTCDIDGDGKPEVILAFGNGISVLINGSTVGNINFPGLINKATGTTAQVVATGDIDGDGRADLAISNFGSSDVSVLINTSSVGAITFAAQKKYGVGTNPIGLAIDDINGDGLPDIISSNEGSSNTSVLINTSTAGVPSFNAAINQACGAGTVALVVFDVDGDGRPDVATANNTANTLSVILNSFYVLAVEAIYLTNIKTTNGVQLNWTTLTEINSKFFYIAKSNDGINFTVFDTLLVVNNGTQKTSYNYTDKSPALGLNYYRLNTEDPDGNLKFSNVNLVKWQKISDLKIRITPMPITSISSVSITGIAGGNTFVIFDINGKTVKKYILADGISDFQIDHNNMLTGIYFYQLISNLGDVKATGTVLMK